MRKRCRFIDDMGAATMDLRGRPKCYGCGIRISLKNWGGSVSQLDDKRKDVRHYCDKKECELKSIRD